MTDRYLPPVLVLSRRDRSPGDVEPAGERHRDQDARRNCYGDGRACQPSELPESSHLNAFLG